MTPSLLGMTAPATPAPAATAASISAGMPTSLAYLLFMAPPRVVPRRCRRHVSADPQTVHSPASAQRYREASPSGRRAERACPLVTSAPFDASVDIDGGRT